MHRENPGGSDNRWRWIWQSVASSVLEDAITVGASEAKAAVPPNVLRHALAWML
ncbi:hypothetical protein BD779DRAFT_1553874 [Infundibulicybe gibba]|nr:hypothetical protein BD779DRAFT_1553874 [Infundibulicybe gibba]